VGGVLAGLATGRGPDEVDPATGEILVTNEPADEGRQHLWEAFPGRADETTVYLFYYARAGHEGSLAELYARFFARLPLYKRGDARLLRPTFGYIPAWSRLGPPPRSGSSRVVLVGDAASRHSPLTMCGFGAMLRSFEPAARELARAIDSGSAPRSKGGSLADDRPIHALTGALALLMALPPRDPKALNHLLDAAFGTLASLPDDSYAELLRDEMMPDSLIRFLRAISLRHPGVYADVLGVLPAPALGRWGLRVALEAVRAL
jgi:lycopene cyclase CruA